MKEYKIALLMTEGSLGSIKILEYLSRKGLNIDTVFVEKISFKSSLKSFSTSLRLELDANGCIKSHDNFEYQRRASNYKEELMLFDLLVAFTLERKSDYQLLRHFYFYFLT